MKDSEFYIEKIEELTEALRENIIALGYRISLNGNRYGKMPVQCLSVVIEEYKNDIELLMSFSNSIEMLCSCLEERDKK